MRNDIPEVAFQRQILDLADIFGWTSYHTYESRRSRRGFPDLVMVRRGRLVFAELKSEGAGLRDEQKMWLEELSAVEQRSLGVVKVRLWRPSDWQEIEKALTC